jgi:hypothetical protein
MEKIFKSFNWEENIELLLWTGIKTNYFYLIDGN